MNQHELAPQSGDEVIAIGIAAGDFVSPATLNITGTDYVREGTRIELTGTTSAGPYGLDITLERDYFVREFAYLFGDYLQGWNQSTAYPVDHPTAPDTYYVALLAKFGGTVVTLDSITVTPPV